MATSKQADRKMLINRVTTLVKSVDRSPAGAAGRLIVDLESTVVKIEALLNVAWPYCGTHPNNEDAFNGFMELLDAYEIGSYTIAIYRSK